ncbi:transcriptional regulator [Solimonas fluminis]|jgi:transcriptional regulator with XRE-family HTH domain|uniref:Transcriptional regulator n=1 Tax=Solimonas fluminis TaxID=2086571 RepID=A0A2S5TJR0_9GAMM|nr:MULTISPECIES: helix-turn-helix transcriptional regulator [Solimonas]MDM4771611.1 helix-turn-helix transcriptional regulator [Solimonas sp. SE-A11]PPE75230.1 transcriptional regulator [Solimonas fluminis]HEX4895763.1 helix-turn-helix transcriptional regulator [Solimonas sp.]
MKLAGAFAESLRKVRLYADLSQEDFSDVSSRTYISSLERGMKSPTLEKVDALAGKMRVSPLSLYVLTYAIFTRTTPAALLRQVSDEVSQLQGKAPNADRIRPSRGRINVAGGNPRGG